MADALVFRRADKKDVFFIVQMLADDQLGASREQFENPLPDSYYQAFEAINRDPNQELMVVEMASEIIGTLQLTFIPYLTYRGGVRAQIEAVRIRADQRRLGLGQAFFRWAIDRATERGAHVLQLTTDKKRPEALRFYENLGFRASHEGMKLFL